MSLSRILTVFWSDLRFQLRRPMFWIMMLILALVAFGLSTGTVRIESGDSDVGGTKSWITSEFALALFLSVVVLLVYSFFVAVASGMAVIRDEELKVGEILHSTCLRPAEYVWGKFLSVLTSFVVALLLYLAFSAFCFHLLPNADAAKYCGPFDALNYVRPGLFFGLPMILFFGGLSFAAGEWTRRPILVFVLPVATLLVCAFFLMSWTPTWLDPRIDRALMLVDPSGFRWLNETWLKVDRGVDFYNHERIVFDGPFLMSRLGFVGLGLLGVVASQFHFARSLRGARLRRGRRAARTGDEHVAKTDPSEEPIPALGMRVAAPGLVRATIDVARFELRGLLRQPGMYLFIPLILIEAIGGALVQVGPFETPLLSTPGTFAVASMNVLVVLVSLLLLFYTVESIEREWNTGLAAIYYSTPVKTASVLFGKALANSFVGFAIIVATLLAGIVVFLIQGKVAIDLAPFGIVWGLLLVPTFVVWTAFVTAVRALTGNRYATYGLCLGALVLTQYLHITDKMSWVGNWDLSEAVRWTDMGVLELDRQALVLNRIAVLGMTVLFTAIAVRIFPRKEFDPARIVVRLRPRSLWKGAWRLLPFAIVPFVALVMLWSRVSAGFQGKASRIRHEEYWKKNIATFKDAPLPVIASVDLDVTLEPATHRFHTRGTYVLVNRHDFPLALVPLTAGDHWENVRWTTNGEAKPEPENRANLYVFQPSPPLAPGGRITIGFDLEGEVPLGITENGGSTEEFILPSGVVLTSFSPSFVPVLGYEESIGVDEDNRYESRVYPDDFYKGITEAAFGGGEPFTASVRVTAPEEYTVNSIGTLVEDSTENGRRTVLWKSDHPVNFFNIVAGRWDVRRGEGTALYYHPGHPYNVEEMGVALDAARRYYSDWFHPFPWQELKLSEFPALASYAQGFPTDITFSESIGFLTKSSPKVHLAFLVTAHEAAHQWWGNLVCPGKGPGGNILAEGTAHFSTILLLEQVKGLQARIESCKRLEERYAKQRQQDSERPLVKIDGSREGDTTVTYDKGGWVFWMLHELMGREASLRGIRAFFSHYVCDRDHPVLQDYVESMRPFAPDPVVYDAFVKQWFFDVVLPEYHLTAKRERLADETTWVVTATVENVGTGCMPIDVAAIRGDRFVEQSEAEAAKEPAPISPDYRETRTATPLVLGPGEKGEVTLQCSFEPEQVLVDPDARVLQLRRAKALVRF